jgi:hypothetical protein
LIAPLARAAITLLGSVLVYDDISWGREYYGLQCLNHFYHPDQQKNPTPCCEELLAKPTKAKRWSEHGRQK